jgi:hypothetical protein
MAELQELADGPGLPDQIQQVAGVFRVKRLRSAQAVHRKAQLLESRLAEPDLQTVYLFGY